MNWRRTRQHPLWKGAALVLGLWMIVVGLFTVQMQVSADFTWKRALSHSIVHWGPWVLLTPPILWLARRYTLFTQSQRAKTFAIHVLASLLCVFLAEVLAFQVLGQFFPDGTPRHHRTSSQNGERPRAERGAGPPPHQPGRRPPRRDLYEGPLPPRGPSKSGKSGKSGPPQRLRPEHPKPAQPGFKPILIGAVSRTPRWLPIYWVIVSIQSIVLVKQRLQRRETQALELKTKLVEAELQTLKLQLQPHFLFNALNAVTTLIHSDPAKADDMVCQLSVLLRGVLQEREASLVPLSRELELLRAYLAIEKTRFGDQLTIEESIAPNCLEVPCPVLLLQPLAENAIRHGLEPKRGSGRLSLTARLQDDRLELTLEDDGVGPPSEPGTPKGFGVGLSNAEARLQTMYGEGHYELRLEAPPDGGTRVFISLPMTSALTCTPTPVEKA